MKLINKAKPLKKPYTILNESDIRHRQNEQISHIASVLTVSISEACFLLGHYKWNTPELCNHWFANESLVRNKVGLFVHGKDQISNFHNNEIICRICFDENLSIDHVYSTNCGDHYYCRACWTNYIRTSMNESGSGCLSMRCPDPSCLALVGQNMICELVSMKDEQKYLTYFIRSYVDGKKDNIKWCPAPGCDRAVEFKSCGGSSGYDVVCECSHCFCWNCGEEAHRPVTCNVAAKWIVKNYSEVESMQWILAYTKPCPKCKQPIEKNLGCSHMTCRSPCRHQFCWLCLGDWKNRENHESCSHLHAAGRLNDAKTQRKLAPLYIVKHTKCYERWLSNHKSRKKAIQDLHNLQTNQLPKLCDRVSKPMSELEFIVKAWNQIIECRQVLKWSYAYGYLLLEHDNVKRLQLLERLQQKTQSRLKGLHYCVKIELSENFLSVDGEMKANFKEFRKKLSELTKGTGSCNKKLVRAVDNGILEEVVEGSSKGKSSLGVLSLIKVQASKFISCFGM